MTDEGTYDLGETETIPAGERGKTLLIFLCPTLVILIFCATMWQRNEAYGELAQEAIELRRQAAKLEDARKVFTGRHEHVDKAMIERIADSRLQFEAELPEYREHVERHKRRVRRYNFHNGGPMGQPRIDNDYPLFDGY